MKNWLDKILLLVALVVAGGATFLSLQGSDTSTGTTVPGAPTGAQFSKTLSQVEPPEAEVWPAPPAQKDDWVFEVFTPPKIYFNQQSAEFVIVLPDQNTVVRQVTPFGMELVEIRRDGYRIQLKAYSGDFGNFEINGQYVVRGRPGREFEDEKFRVLSLVEERHVDDSVEGATPLITRRGIARVLDLTNNREYTLVSDELVRNDFPVAELQVRTRSYNQTRVLREGDVWETDEARYRLDRIDEQNGAVVVTKVSLADPSEVTTETLSASGRFEIPTGQEQILDLLQVQEAPDSGAGSFFDPIPAATPEAE